MSTFLRFESITLVTETERVAYRLGSAPIALVVGPVGAGKTSLLELLKYGIGGKGVLSQVVGESVRGIVVEARLGETRVSLGRRINSSTIDAYGPGGELIETFSTVANKRYPMISDYLLECVGIPALPISKKRTTGATNERLSFFDVFRYVYVQQSEIDRSVVRHVDTLLEGRRRLAFEAMFGLSDAETASAERRVQVLKGELQSKSVEATAVERFLQHGATEPQNVLEGEILVLDKFISDAAAEMQAIRSQVKSSAAHENDRQFEIARLGAEARQLSERAIELQAELQTHAESVAQVELQIEQLRKTRSARRVLDQVEFSRCPRCVQALERAVPEGHCLVCLQADVPSPTLESFVEDVPDGQLPFGQNLTVLDERNRLEALREELRTLGRDVAEEFAGVVEDLKVVEVSLQSTLNEIDRRTAEYVTPYFETIAEVSAGLASARARREAVQAGLDLWADLARLNQEREVLSRQLDAAKRAVRSAFDQLAARRSILDEISAAFDEMIQLLEPPWYRSARIDPDTYLPDYNDGAAFSGLSGGQKTMINIAYHLSLLTVALSRRDTLYPSLLMIDTPRKNLGSGSDQEIAGRMYRQFRALADAHGAGLQVIIADNDPPPIPLPSISIPLSYESPLVPGRPHPGPDVETIDSRQTD